MLPDMINQYYRGRGQVSVVNGRKNEHHYDLKVLHNLEDVHEFAHPWPASIQTLIIVRQPFVCRALAGAKLGHPNRGESVSVQSAKVAGL